MTDDGFAPVLGPIGTLIEQAYSYAGLGLDIFPVNPTNKTPLVSQLTATTDLDTIEAWWTQWPTALLGHRIHPQHLILDIDPRHGGKDTWDALKAEMPTFVTRTHLSGRGDGGGHVWFQRPADQVTITKLDTWAREHGTGQQVDQRWVCGIDILRHEHRYTILPPSHHPATGRPYYWAKGKGLNLEPGPMPSLLVELIEKDATPAPRAPSEPRYSDPDSIADWYTGTTTWTQILAPHGWQLVSGDGEENSRWRHPTATSAFSATIRYGCLFVYSPNTPFDVTYPDEPHGYTPFRAWATLDHHGDLTAAGRAARALRGPAATHTPVTKPAQSTNGATPATQRKVALTPASDVQLRRVRWCWDGRLATGTLGLLAGPEGLGKSTVAFTIGANLTRGQLPGEYAGQNKAVLVCATEDSWAHTIAPRFLAAGADMKLVYKIDVQVGDDLLLGLNLPYDLDALEDGARQTGAALLILDPLISRLDVKLDSHKDGEVRQALEPLTAMADTTGMSILGLIHHNKSGSTNPLDAIMASKAFTAVARSVHTVIRDPDDETGLRRYFGTPKNNLGSTDLPSMSFTIEPFFYPTDDGEGSTGKIVWGTEVHESIADLLHRATEDPEQRTAVEEAAEWLGDYLRAGGGRVASSDAKSSGRAAGHNERTLKRALKRLKLTVESEGFPRKTWWALTVRPSEDTPPPSPKPVPTGPTVPDQELVGSNQSVGTKESLPTRARPDCTEVEAFELTRYCRCGQPATDISGLCPGCITNPGTLPPIDPHERF